MEPTRSEYKMETRKLFISSLMFSGLCLGSLYELFFGDKILGPQNSFERIVLVVICVSCALAFANFYLNVFTRGSALVLTKEGFLQPAFTAKVIPWSSVISVERSSITTLTRTKSSSGCLYKVNIDPVFAKGLPRSGLLRRLGWRWQNDNSFTYLPLNALTGDTNVIADQFDRYLAESKN